MLKREQLRFFDGSGSADELIICKAELRLTRRRFSQNIKLQAVWNGKAGQSWAQYLALSGLVGAYFRLGNKFAD